MKPFDQILARFVRIPKQLRYVISSGLGAVCLFLAVGVPYPYSWIVLPLLWIVVYFAAAAGLRFVIEFFRGDHTETYFGLSLYQLVCLGLITVALVINSRLKSTRK
jgi:prolipoprotein diacylglyceryltransferase